jgi:hypothetical protein
MRSFQKWQKVMKAFSGMFAVAALLFGNAAPASAGLFGSGGVPSVSSIASQIESRYHMNLNSLQSTGESMNVSGNKLMSPEVSIFFSPTDPKAGEKIMAQALPMYFSNSNESIYYTWYLKHSGCGLDNSPSSDKEDLCDRDGNGKITVEDWKIEAARIIAKNGYDNSDTSYDSDSDDDGYKARYGGDTKASTPDYCYVHDNLTGANYELSTAGGTDFDCPSGTSPACMSDTSDLDSLSLDTSSTINITTSSTGACVLAGWPICSSDKPACDTGTPRCVKDPTTSTSCGSSLTSCTTDGGSVNDKYCKHLFPDASGETTGDGDFGAKEEKFWRTDPADSSTADNGNKDEANVAGLGQETFSWNYDSGDQVGVVVEGTSMITTKHDDSSSMIMWAFSKNDCPVSIASDSIGSYVQTIQGYSVTIPTIDMDLNDCLERNLVDPTEGGQSTALKVNVTSSPDDPVNDSSGDDSGDTVAVQASLDNSSSSLSGVQFDWKVEMSKSSQFDSDASTVTDVTSIFQTLGLLGNTKGNALTSLNMNLDIPSTFSGKKLSSYLTNGVGYLRFSVKASENFSSGVVRKGNGSVIVKFVSTDNKIVAYRAAAVASGSLMHVKLPGSSGIICNDSSLERSNCSVVSNEVIGLRVNPDGLSNFSWTVNGVALTCSEDATSPDCTDGSQNEINFLPITGGVGTSYAVTVTANDVTTGKAVTLSRTFTVVNPSVSIVPADEVTVWPKILGQYKDLTGSATECTDGLCNDYSTTIMQAFAGNEIMLKAQFTPSFLASAAKKAWTVDGTSIDETSSGNVVFSVALSDDGSDRVYDVNLNASYSQSDDIRKALYDIWGVSQFDSSEFYFSDANQIEVSDPILTVDGSVNKTKFLAAIASYIPASLMFTFRIILSGILVVFVSGFLLALIPESTAVSRRS